MADDRQTTPESAAPKPERRKKVPRRRQIDPTTCERDYSDDEIEFMHALDEYKRANGRMFPTCSEILEVVRDLGYAKVEKPPTPTEESNSPETSDEINPQTVDPNIIAENHIIAVNAEPETFGHVPGFSTPPEHEVPGLPIADLPSDFTDAAGSHSF
ncbi:hypothetical protein ACFL2H_02415 [Planctomycetota bacterium]